MSGDPISPPLPKPKFPLPRMPKPKLLPLVPLPELWLPGPPEPMFELLSLEPLPKSAPAISLLRLEAATLENRPTCLW
ncbi:Uncharacterised protein [Mycobacterium tuberculosis]|nr:Uncharacterised protein [Mycobacterium tuberculosis]